MSTYDWASMKCIDCNNCKDYKCTKGVFENCCPETISIYTKACSLFEPIENIAADKIKKMWNTFVKCEACKNYIYNTESPDNSKCAIKRRKIKDNQTACDKFEAHDSELIIAEQEAERVEDKKDIVTQNVHTSTRVCGKCNSGHWYSEDHTYVSVVDDDGIKTTKRPCEAHTHYCYQVDGEQKKIATDKDFNPDVAPEWCPFGVAEKKKPRIGTESGCVEMREDCPHFCKHNDGCSVLLIKGDALESVIKEHGNIDCDVYRRVANKVLENEQPEIKDETVGIVAKEPESVNEFDYSTVDADTAEYLQEKQNRITFINAGTSYSIGKELKEAQEKLANHKNGVFQKWVRSMGISDDTAYNYINNYNFITEQFGDIGNAESFLTLPKKLQYAVSKPSAPKELQEQVLSGDITTHKEYKEKEAEWKAKVEEIRKQQETLRTEKQQAVTRAFDAERKADRLESDIEELKDQLEELQNQKAENQNSEEVVELKNRIAELEKQLKEKPIETSAVQIVEQVPQKAATDIQLRLYGTLMAAKLVTKEDIQIVHDTANFERKEAIIEFLENLRDMIPGYLDILKDNVLAGKCERCMFCSWDGLKEDDEQNGFILCTGTSAVTPQLWRNDQPCGKFIER